MFLVNNNLTFVGPYYNFKTRTINALKPRRYIPNRVAALPQQIQRAAKEGAVHKKAEVPGLNRCEVLGLDPRGDLV